VVNGILYFSKTGLGADSRVIRRVVRSHKQLVASCEIGYLQERTWGSRGGVPNLNLNNS